MIQNIEQDFRVLLMANFRHLNGPGARNRFPAPKSLSETLNNLIPKQNVKHASGSPKIAANFATAAVDMWLRSVHSFLISASLTKVSPIWASATGYYSSHYTVRGLAHLLGYFNLYGRKKIVRLTFEDGNYVCAFNKTKVSGEHQLYWKIVNESKTFEADPLFTLNNPQLDVSDAGHRNYANYVDHIYNFPVFFPLDQCAVRHRIEYISKIPYDAPPIPTASRFPDVDSVQLVAYYRLVKFRNLLDEVLVDKNQFWNLHRKPSAASEYMNFQLVDGGGLSQFG